MSDQTESLVGRRTRTLRVGIHENVSSNNENDNVRNSDRLKHVGSSGLVSSRGLTGDSRSMSSKTARFVTEPGTAPEHSTGDIITVWRFGKDVVDCKVIKELGRGAQAVVFLVQSQGRECALKVASVLPVADEARALLRVNSPHKHPHVLEAQYVCSPVGSDNELLFLQELIRGASLAELIESGQLYDVAEGEGDAPELQLQQRLGTMFVQLLAALAHVHACGVLHQDVKPDNIMVDTTTWDVYLIDFGIATIANEGAFDRRGAIRAQMRGGTAAYLSPEQNALMRDTRAARGGTERRKIMHARELTQHADIWGAVATCLDMFSGGGKWRGERRSADAWRKMGNSLATLLEPGAMRVALPPALVPVLESCLGDTKIGGGRGAALTAQRAADAAAQAVACDAPAPVPGLAPELAGAMHANVALALHRRRRKDKAEACYRDAVAATQSREPRALNNLGVLRAQSGDTAEARRCFELATKLDAGYQEANANLVRLRDRGGGGGGGGGIGGKPVLDMRG